MPERPPTHRYPDNREAILRSALDLFARKGYAGTAVREIVEAAGATKPVLYYHFKSKEGLYLEILRQAMERFRADLTVLTRGGGDAETGLMRLCGQLFVLFRENLQVVRLVHAALVGPPQGGPPFDFKRFHEELVKGMGWWVDEGIRRGEFRDGDQASMTIAVYGVFSLAVELELLSGECGIGREGLSAAMNVVFEGMRAGDSASL